MKGLRVKVLRVRCLDIAAIDYLGWKIIYFVILRSLTPLDAWTLRRLATWVKNYLYCHLTQYCMSTHLLKIPGPLIARLLRFINHSIVVLQGECTPFGKRILAGIGESISSTQK